MNSSDKNSAALEELAKIFDQMDRRWGTYGWGTAAMDRARDIIYGALGREVTIYGMPEPEPHRRRLFSGGGKP